MAKKQAQNSTAKKPGANAQALKNALEGYRHPRVDTKDVHAIADRIDVYLRYCIKNDMSPTVAGCANWLGIAVSTLQNWYTGSSGTPEHQRVAARFYGIVQDVWQTDMHEGNVNPVAGIFVGKVFYGYKDTQEIIVQHKDSGDLPLADLIAESKRLPGGEQASLPDNSTIDADYTVIENDPAYEKAVARQKRKEEREANKTPGEWTNKKEYHQAYYKAHKREIDKARFKNAKIAEERKKQGITERRKPGPKKKAETE